MKFLTIKPLRIKAQPVKSFLGMLKGFMFSAKGKAKLFILDKERKIDIHMLFVFFPLVIVWLDKNKRIVSFKKANPFFFWHSEKVKYVLETPDLRILKKLRKGMKLSWK